MKKRYFVYALVLIVAVVGLMIFYGSFYVVNEGEYGVVRRFAKVVDVQSEAGLYVKMPFIDSVSTLPEKKQLYDMQPSDVLTSDKKAMIVDNYVIWRITDPLTFIQTVSFVFEMEGRIDAAVYNSIKNTMGTMEQTAIISDSADNGSRLALNQVITEQVNEQLKSYGVEVLSVEIKRFDLPSDNEQAVFSRMISEREQMAASYRAEGNYEAAKIRNEVDKQVSIIQSEAEAKAAQLEGEGEAEYMRILSEAYAGDDRASFFEFMRSLEAARAAMSGEKTLILPADSPIAKIFLGE